MSTTRGKLGNILKEVINWNWLEFVEAEKAKGFSSLDGIIFSLVRACSDGKLGPIRLALNRIDGKVETPVEVIYPKFICLYPEATSVVQLKPSDSTPVIEPGDIPEEKGLVTTTPPPEEAEVVEDVVTLTLREAVEKLAQQDRTFVKLILDEKKAVEAKDPKVINKAKIVSVKAVIAANLLKLAQTHNNFDAITEVFDQIDGKLVETIRVLGEDIYLTSYIEEAPYGAKKNENGIYQLEAPQISDIWKAKLKQN